MKATITGINGFIGSALNKRLLTMGWETTPVLSPLSNYVFLFGSPSSDYWFLAAKSYSLRETIDNFISVADFCQFHQIKLIYPSSGTVYEGTTPYAITKKIIEEIASMYKNTLGFRIFAGYGPDEGHKGEYASIIYKFIMDMKHGKRPMIYGDGYQTRDFVYIDDIVQRIILFRDMDGVLDIGTGFSTSFNDVIHLIDNKLHTGIKPLYVDKPVGYIEETVCPNPFRPSISVNDGINHIIESL